MYRITIAIGAMALSTGAVRATQSSVPFLNADDVHAQGITGRAVTVAVIDEGIDYGDHGLIGSIAEGGISIVDGEVIYDNGAALPGFTHGTYMSLIITDVAGVAPNADILPVRIVGPSGEPTGLDLFLAIHYVRLLRRADPSIRVMNMSLGTTQSYACPCDLDHPALADAVSQAAAEGIVPCAATGNDAICGGISAPACLSSAVKVAGDYDAYYPPTYFDPPGCGDISPDPYWVICFSNISEACDYLVAAPGYAITVGGFSGNGTSQAAAHCSGVAALMFEKNRCGSLDAYSARSTIFNTAWEYEWAYPYCPLPPQPRHVNALAAVNAVAAGACATLAGDMDCDGTVSLLDSQRFAECMTGPGGGPVTGACTCADLPTSPPDGDVDLHDFAAFQVAFTGWGQGACCYPDGACTDGLPVDECLSELGATYQGHGTTCDTVECPVPNWGACCLAGGSCTEETVEDCIWGEGLYLGGGTQCASVDCPTVPYQNFVLNPSSPTYTSCGSGLALADDLTLAAGSPNGLVYYDLTVYGGGVGSGTFDATVSLHTGWPPTGANQISGTEFTWTDLSDGPAPAHLHAVMDPAVTIPDTVWMKADFSDQNAGWFIGGSAEIGSTQDYFGRYDPPWTLYWWEGDPHAGLWATLGCVEP